MNLEGNLRRTRNEINEKIGSYVYYLIYYFIKYFFEAVKVLVAKDRHMVSL
jgi:hypothetical protein